MFARLVGQHPLAAAEYQILRMEAVESIENCLTRGEDGEFIAFVQAQIASQPPRLNLLRDIADELSLRLLALRQHRLDVWDRVVEILLADYGIDVACHCPADASEHHVILSAEETISSVEHGLRDSAAQDLALIRRLVQASVEMARQLSADIQLTEHVYETVVDWLMGLSSHSSRSVLSQRTRSDRKNDPSRLH
jgi:hypothetical protein